MIRTTMPAKPAKPTVEEEKAAERERWRKKELASYQQRYDELRAQKPSTLTEDTKLARQKEIASLRKKIKYREDPARTAEALATATSKRAAKREKVEPQAITNILEKIIWVPPKENATRA